MNCFFVIYHHLFIIWWMICWKKREKLWLPSSEAQINDPKTQRYSVNSHVRQRKAANLRSWSQLKWPLLVQKGKTTLRIPKDIRKLFTPRRVFSGVEIMGPCTEALKFHPNYWETFPGPCVCVCLSLGTCVAGDRGESGGSRHGSSSSSWWSS